MDTQIYATHYNGGFHGWPEREDAFRRGVLLAVRLATESLVHGTRPATLPISGGEGQELMRLLEVLAGAGDRCIRCAVRKARGA